ncbi:MAG TPA: SpoIID/LytB domain-containing protein [Waterburya sp.]
MFRLPKKHPILNRSVLWPIFLFSTALFVPWVLAESLPNRLQPKPSASTPSSQSQLLPQPSPDSGLAEREWHHRVVSQTLSQQPTPETTTSTTASNSPVSQTTPSPSTSADSQANPPQSSKPISQAQASESSKTSHQPRSKSQRTQKNKAKASSASHQIRVIQMRVAIANGDKSLLVGTSTPGEVRDARGKLLGKLPANQATNVLPNGSNLRVDKWNTPTGVLVKPTNGGYVFVGDKWYRGNLLLVSQGSSLLAVNYVELESYIASVVGSEVSPSWPIDALKAQAIAARSYALVHYIRPAHSLYDLGNTERWQVYKGVSSEWNTTRQAVEDTRGLFLSYKGGVVESMYAASDEIVKNVFGGRGMSQKGALSLAQKGYNYQQILSNYYPGTSLAWIDGPGSDNQ